MLEMKSHCEECGLATGSEGVAYICSYECTFCQRCSDGMEYICPNCSGELMARPKRTADPASPHIA